MASSRYLAAVGAALAISALVVPRAVASESPCARANGDPVALLAELTGKDKLPEVFRDAAYVALQDKSTWAMWTFTLPGHRAHPAVVCRRPVQEGDVITLDMVVTCNGEPNACVGLSQEFKALNAIMAQEMNKGR
ncbi:MAG: hypothetical protein AB1749_14155 [Pseudomonadota bacterium]